MQRLILVAWLAFLAISEAAHAQGPTPDKDGWYHLFDGKTLEGWKAGDEPKAFKVEDGLIVAGGTKLTHLFYVGPIFNATFRNFELKAEVKTRPKGNSGIIFHTEWQAKGFPDKGFEFQINNTGSDKVFRTGSIYPAKPMNRIVVKDDEWFECHLLVKANKVVLKVNGEITMDTTLPHEAKTGRTLGSGTIAIQGHDPGSIVYFRSIRVKPLAGDAGPQEKASSKVGDPLRIFKGHIKEVIDVAFNPDGTRLASASRDGTVRIWNTTNGKEVHTLKGHDNFVDGVAFSPDGKWLASGGWDAFVRLWDPATGKEIHKLPAGDPGNDSVRCVAFSPDSKKLIAVGMLVAAGDHEPILIWDVATGTRERKLDGQVTNGLFSVSFTRDGKHFATAGYVGGIRVWNSATGRVVKPLHWDGDERCAISQVVFSRDGKMLASAGDDQMIRLWDVDAGREVRKLQGHAGGKGKGVERGQIVTSVAFRRDGNLLASAAANEGTVRLWDLATGREVCTIKAHTGTVQRVVFHPDGQLLATAGADGTVKLWDTSAVHPLQKEAENKQ